MVKGINVLSKHETFEINHKKYYYGDKNKFNKNSYFFHDKNNFSNKNTKSNNYNNKENEMLRKIKNLKTFHPGKNINNKKSISIKTSKDNQDKNKNINNDNANNNKNNNNNNNNNNNIDINNKNNESEIKEKDNNKTKAPQTNKFKENINNNDKEEKINRDLSKEKNEKKQKENDINENLNKKDENNIMKKDNEKEKEKEKENNIHKNDKSDKNIKDNIKKENKDNKTINKDENKENQDPQLINDKNKDKEKEKEIKISSTPSLSKKEEEIKKDDDEKKIYFDTSKITDVQIPKDYLNIIYYNLLEEESKELNPKPIYTYMKNQKEINDQMRSILVDWIIDVHHKFGFTDETLFMTVLIIDRYCSIEQITRIKYQCLGITALMISCKHEEINVPKVEDFIYITDNAYTKDEVFQMENDVLSKLNFELLYPSPIKFYEYLSLHFNFNKKYHMLGKYLMESFLLDLNYIKYKPSVISCACTYIVMKFFKMPNYRHSYEKKFYLLNENMHTIGSGFGVKDCAQDICLYVDNINNTNLLSCQKKYAKNEFECVSILISNNNNNKS